jgi:hypothetical protein
MQYQLYYDNYFLSYVGAEAKGFNGMILRTGRGFPTADLQWQGQYHKDGSVFHGMTPDGMKANQGDPKVNSLIDQMRQEFEPERQKALSHELIRYYVEQAYTIPRPTVSKAFNLNWPVIGNLRVWNPWLNTGSVEQRIHWWIDARKPPIGTS